MNQAATYKQPWISRPWLDAVFILFPPFGCLLFIFLFPQLFQNNNELNEVWWVALILLVDVAHVYSTLYRTYFDPNALQKQKALLWGIPVFAFISAVLIYSMSSMWFWRILAYVAVYHFIRQQYGFMRLYSRKEAVTTWFKRIDSVTIYYATLYPILYWHLTAPKNFNWLIQDDFIYIQSSPLLAIATWLYYAVLLAYFIKELVLILKSRRVNLPRNAVIIGTLVSWYFGIVYFNGDMAFTLLNVVSHGIPYMALIWVYGEKNYQSANNKRSILLNYIFSRKWVWLFLGLIFLFAFVEEGLWDSFVWKEHRNTFSIFQLKDFTVSKELLNILVPLLAVPQITHYVIDGFIWKIRKDNFKWNNEVPNKSNSLQA